jgi:hypothetical protein
MSQRRSGRSSSSKDGPSHPTVKHFRLVFTARAGGEIFRGPRAQRVVPAETLEAAIRQIKSANRWDAKFRYNDVGETEFFKVEEATEEDYFEQLRDAIEYVGEHRGETRSALDYERRLAERQRARRLKPFKVVGPRPR